MFPQHCWGTKHRWWKPWRAQLADFGRSGNLSTAAIVKWAGQSGFLIEQGIEHGRDPPIWRQGGPYGTIVDPE